MPTDDDYEGSKRVTLRLDVELLAYLQHRAKKNRRTVSGEIEMILYRLSTDVGLQTAFETGFNPLVPKTLTNLKPEQPSDSPMDSEITPTPLQPFTSTFTPKQSKAASGYRGVYPYGAKWQACASKGGIRQRLGVFDTPKEAANALAAYKKTEETIEVEQYHVVVPTDEELMRVTAEMNARADRMLGSADGDDPAADYIDVDDSGPAPVCVYRKKSEGDAS